MKIDSKINMREISMYSKSRDITLVAILAVVIAISGTFKLPGLIPGTEFQMSAPIAIGICATFGFKRYITAGVLASVINLLMGTHTILNVIVAMVFRIVAGSIIGYLGTGLIIVSMAGPIGTIVGRVAMSYIVGTPIKVLLAAALPGMIYTLLSSYFIYKAIDKIVKKTPYKNYNKNLNIG